MSARAWAGFAAMSTVWGIPYLFIKVAVDDGVPPAVVAWSRVVLAAVVLLALAWRAGTLPTLRGRGRWLALFALFGTGAQAQASDGQQRVVERARLALESFLDDPSFDAPACSGWCAGACAEVETAAHEPGASQCVLFADSCIPPHTPWCAPIRAMPPLRWRRGSPPGAMQQSCIGCLLCTGAPEFLVWWAIR